MSVPQMMALAGVLAASKSVLYEAYMWFDADDWAGASTASANRGTDGTRYTITPNSGIALGTNAGGNYWEAGTAGDKLEVFVNGSQDIPNGDKLHLPGDFTIMIAHKVDSVTDNFARLMDKSSDTFSAQGYTLRRNTGSESDFDFHANQSTTLSETASSEQLINNAAWAYSGAHEIWAMTMDTSGNYVQYEDATSVASGTSTVIRNKLININDTGIKMQFFDWGQASGSRPMAGRIYGIAFWDRVLTSDEISEVYDYYQPRMV